MRSNYPETSRYLAARRAQHPRDDAIEDYTEWTLMGQPVNNAPVRPNLPGTTPSAAEAAMTNAPKEETHEQYIQMRSDAYLHQMLSSRRSVGGKLFTIGGGGDGGCAYLVV